MKTETATLLAFTAILSDDLSLEAMMQAIPDINDVTVEEAHIMLETEIDSCSSSITLGSVNKLADFAAKIDGQIAEQIADVNKLTSLPSCNAALLASSPLLAIVHSSSGPHGWYSKKTCNSHPAYLLTLAISDRECTIAAWFEQLFKEAARVLGSDGAKFADVMGKLLKLAAHQVESQRQSPA